MLAAVCQSMKLLLIVVSDRGELPAGSQLCCQLMWGYHGGSPTAVQA